MTRQIAFWPGLVCDRCCGVLLGCGLSFQVIGLVGDGSLASGKTYGCFFGFLCNGRILCSFLSLVGWSWSCFGFAFGSGRGGFLLLACCGFLDRTWMEAFAGSLWVTGVGGVRGSGSHG